MALPFGPTLRRSLALVGLGGDLRSQAALAHRAGYRGVQLNAASPGVRPRELGRSARRDVLALLRRHELEVSGVDLWIPTEHFTDPGHASRAMDALCEAVRFAAEMGAPVVSCMLGEDAGVRDHAEGVCASAGCRIADHGWPTKESAGEGGAIGVGIDPAVVLAAEGKGKGIGRLIAGIGRDVMSARLSDLDGGGRVEAGSGSLDLMSYEATLVTVGYAGMLVVDVRGLADPIGSAERLAGG